MTRREYLENKLQKRKNWAVKAHAASEARFNSAQKIASNIPFGQPILIGHHSERRHRRDAERIASNMDHGCERADMATKHESKAAGIADQLDNSIFSDDDNAVEAIKARIVEREAEIDRIKKYNASCRKAMKEGRAMGDLNLLDEKQKADIMTIFRVCPSQLGPSGSAPAYLLANLRGRITADKKRIAGLEWQARQKAKAKASGGLLITRGQYSCSVRFAEKPEYSTIKSLKESGFYWSGGQWNGNSDKIPACVLEMEKSV